VRRIIAKQVLKKGSSSGDVDAKIDFGNSSVILTIPCNTGKHWSINPSLCFINLYYTLSLVRCALGEIGSWLNNLCCMTALIYKYYPYHLVIKDSLMMLSHA
jgi:hypothetical protein